MTKKKMKKPAKTASKLESIPMKTTIVEETTIVEVEVNVEVKAPVKKANKILVAAKQRFIY